MVIDLLWLDDVSISCLFSEARVDRRAAFIDRCGESERSVVQFGIDNVSLSDFAWNVIY